MPTDSKREERPPCHPHYPRTDRAAVHTEAAPPFNAEEFSKIPYLNPNSFFNVLSVPEEIFGFVPPISNTRRHSCCFNSVGL